MFKFILIASAIILAKIDNSFCASLADYDQAPKSIVKGLQELLPLAEMANDQNDNDLVCECALLQAYSSDAYHQIFLTAGYIKLLQGDCGAIPDTMKSICKGELNFCIKFLSGLEGQFDGIPLNCKTYPCSEIEKVRVYMKSAILNSRIAIEDFLRSVG